MFYIYFIDFVVSKKKNYTESNVIRKKIVKPKQLKKTHRMLFKTIHLK